MPAIESTRCATRWITRIIPILLAAAVGYATYVVVARICSSYLIDTRGEVGVAIPILILYFLFFLLMVATYARTIFVANFDPGVVPLGPLAIEQRSHQNTKRLRRHKHGDLESQSYHAAPDNDPDSPGLENFYTKNVFVCESDGRPKWCSECCNWKPDRAHHSSEINRCVLRMDHYCPWVGGMIGENSFKFFVQFTTYTACYCAVVLGAAASCLRSKIDEGHRLDPYLVAAIVLAAFFGLFTFLMTVTSMRYILLNMTNVDMLGASSKVYQLAVYVPRDTPSSDRFSVVTYPLPKPDQSPRGRTSRIVTSEASGASHPERTSSPRLTPRDNLATRSFAILKTETGENPWDLGPWRNWQAVMGANLFDWLLPIHKSPCTNHESQGGFYPMGHVLTKVCTRYGLSVSPEDDSNGLEMQHLRNKRT
ncbi:palmitoyltransferase PFA5 [Biscogniauxia mediterranea]|nr:palmitoyltransferase PFA5 [Biscogniauxia mediterranea]